MTRAVALILTALTGFSGLVYEVAWQKYLATLLGSHSEATSAVLAIFLGGLSTGYALFGRVTREHVASAKHRGVPPRLLFLYGLLEGGIGLYVLVFPWFFEAVRALSFAMPHGASGLGFVIDVALTIVLIGPASVMMGGTIPILTQALARSLEDATRFHAFVYAFNTFGAFAGALAAGFVLIPALGLVRVMLFMGLINLFAGSVFLWLGRRGREVVSLEQEKVDGEEAPATGSLVAYHVVALLTGFAMMTLQTTAIRVAGLSFGSSQFTFSMIVAVFVLCIALGSFAVSLLPKIPRAVTTANQWALFGLFVFLYFQFEKTPGWAQMLRSLFRDADGGFAPYYAAAFVGVCVLIGLPVLLSGAVLPLLFHSMRSEADHLGDTAGNLYGWNTVGSLLGALFGGYLLYFWFDLHGVYRVAVLALAVAAIVLTLRAHGGGMALGAIGSAAALAVLVALPAWDHRLLHAGLFRERAILPHKELGAIEIIRRNGDMIEQKTLYQSDDPIASVRAFEIDHGNGERSVSIAVNGKSDGNTFGDYMTMSLLATLPALFAEKAERAFVVGWGTGITAGQLARFESMQLVEVAEISPGVMEAAEHFDFSNFEASRDPKIEVITSDAYRAVVRSKQRYDVIVSEPSNPWVTGVEMLFSRDFLEVAKEKLTPGGVYVQWFHEYETDAEVLDIVLRTYTEVFDHVAIWHSKTPDLFLLGFDDPENALDEARLERRAQRPDFAAAIAAVGIGSFPELLAHEIVPLGVLHAHTFDGPPHTLSHPILADAAGRAFFRGEYAKFPFTGYAEPARIGAANALLPRYIARTGGRLDDALRERTVVEACTAHGLPCYAPLAQWLHDAPNSPAMQQTAARMRQAAETRRRWVEAGNPGELAPRNVGLLAALFNEPGQRRTANFVPLETARMASREFERLYFHPTPFRGDALEAIWLRCGERPPSEAECESEASADEDALRACMQRLRPGPRCRAGLAEARRLITGDHASN